MWHPTLDDMEQAADPPRSQAAALWRDNRHPDTMRCALGRGACWCGPHVHSWPGKADGAPHPRDWHGKANGWGYREEAITKTATCGHCSGTGCCPFLWCATCTTPQCGTCGGSGK